MLIASTRAFDRPCSIAATILRDSQFAVFAGVVPDLAADLVQRVGRELDHVERIDAADRLGDRSATGPAIQPAMSHDTVKVPVAVRTGRQESP